MRENNTSIFSLELAYQKKRSPKRTNEESIVTVQKYSYAVTRGSNASVNCQSIDESCV